MTENARFIEVLNELKKAGDLLDYVEAARVLGTNKAGISDIKAGRKKISVELLRGMKKSYPKIRLEYIIMGTGGMFEQDGSPQSTFSSDTYKDFVELKDSIIEQQKELIKQQREMIDSLTLELYQKGKCAASATAETVAHVG